MSLPRRWRPRTRVALLTEGVDRNYCDTLRSQKQGRSPSSRREWIEIALLPSARSITPSPSSRRAWIEIVKNMEDTRDAKSPSSRRAWIEISSGRIDSPLDHVALLTEGVDRNLAGDRRLCGRARSPSSRRAWIEMGRP